MKHEPNDSSVHREAGEFSAPRPVLDIPELSKTLNNGRGMRLWHSMEEVANTLEHELFLHNEFPYDPANEPAEAKNGIARRDVLKLMAASAALSGLTGCTKLPT